jgi:hypothetical protein
MLLLLIVGNKKLLPNLKVFVASSVENDQVFKESKRGTGQ